MPSGTSDFPFGPVDDGFPERNRETDGRVFDLVVVRIIVFEPPEIVDVQPDFFEERLRNPPS